MGTCTHAFIFTCILLKVNLCVDLQKNVNTCANILVCLSLRLIIVGYYLLVIMS